MKQDDLEIVRFMIEIYCRGKHKSGKGELCQDCEKLWQYVQLRRAKCPFGDKKPFCSNCKIHCHKPDMREKIKEVMRYAGPRMIFYNPRVAFAHLSETLRKKREDKRKLRAEQKAIKTEKLSEEESE